MERKVEESRIGITRKKEKSSAWTSCCRLYPESLTSSFLHRCIFKNHAYRERDRRAQRETVTQTQRNKDRQTDSKTDRQTDKNLKVNLDPRRQFWSRLLRKLI